MMKVCQIIKYILILGVTFLIPMNVTAQKTSPVINIAGRQVNLELVKSNGSSQAACSNENVTLTVEDVVIKNVSSVPKLLIAKGIIPDNESYTLFYDLNSQLDSLEPLITNSKYKFPKIVGGQILNKRLNENCLALLTIDKNLKTELKNKSKALILLAQRFSKIDSLRFDNTETSESVKSSVRDLASWYDHIHKTVAQRTAPPIRKVSLQQIVSEADFLTKLLSRIVNSKNKVKPADYEQIILIHQDIEAIIDRWDEKMAGDLPSAEKQYKVEVIIKGKDSKIIRNLRVYYVMNGYYREPPNNPPVKSLSFNGLGRQVSEILPIHNYKIWIAKDGEPGNYLIKPKLVYVNKDTIIEFSLE